MYRATFQPKDPGEKLSLPLDFSKDLGNETIVGPTAAFTVEAGTDASPGALANGDCVVAGAMVYVPVQAGVPQVDYVVTVTAPTSGGRVLKAAGLLPVRVA